MNKLLILADLTENQNNTFEIGFQLARKLDAQVDLISIIDEKSDMMPADISMDPSLQWEAMSDQARVALENIKSANTDLTIHVAVFVGNPQTDIFNYAIEHQINMIIVSTHGRTGLSHTMIGSLAEYIVRHSPIPVLVVPMKNYLH